LLPKPEIHFKMTPSKKGIKITLTSNKLARNVYLSTDRYEGFFTYNYFDIIPGRPVEIEFQPNEPINVSKFRQVLKIMSLVDAFENLDN
jgi:beta-mannosidase